MNIQNLKPELPDVIYGQIPQIMDTFQINNELRLSRLLGQCWQETGGWKSFSENLNYSIPRMRQVFSKVRNMTDAQLQPYEHNEQAFGNFIYANMLGNGNEASGDGFHYKGRGAIGVTGRELYTKLNHYIPAPDSIINNPELLATKYQLFSAAWFFFTYGLNTIADQSYNNPDAVARITKHVNAASLGADNRQKWAFHYYDVLMKPVS